MSLSTDGSLLPNLFIKDFALFIQYAALGNYSNGNKLRITRGKIEDLGTLLLPGFRNRNVFFLKITS